MTEISENLITLCKSGGMNFDFAGHVTVADVVELPSFALGSPELLSSPSTPEDQSWVRWVHVLEKPEPSQLLEGGEFVLSTAAFLSEQDTAEVVTEYLRRVESVGVVAVGIEILADRPNAARALREAAADATIPVYLISRRIRFVSVTQQVHQRIAAGHHYQLTLDRHIHNVFTELSLSSAQPQRILEEASALAGHEVVWTLSNTDDAPANQAVELSVAGESAGQLSITDEVTDPERDRVQMVLERAAQSLTLSRLNERSQRDLARQNEAAVLHELRDSRHVNETRGVQRVHDVLDRTHPMAKSMIDDAAAWVPLVIRVTAPGSSAVADHQAARDVLDILAEATETGRLVSLAARMEAGVVAVLLPVRARMLTRSGLDQLFSVLAERGLAARLVGGAASTQRRLLTAAAELDEAQRIAEAALALYGVDAPGHSELPYFFASDVRLRGLIATMRTDARVQDFARAELAGILDNPDPVAVAEQLQLLEQLLDAGGNKAALARATHLSRPALYARLNRLENALGVSLEEAESRTSLHTAVLIHRMS